MEYKANSGIWGTMFGVPCVVSDNLLKLTTGEQLKVLLYLLRFTGKNCSPEEISENTGVEVEEVQNAVIFWQKVNVLTPENSLQNGCKSCNSPERNCAESQRQEQPRLPETAQKPEQPQKPEITPADISKIVLENSDIAELLKVSENTLGPLSYNQQNSLIWIYSNLGLKREVIVVLLNYCLSINKTYMPFIEKIACQWSDDGINTLELAQKKVAGLAEATEHYSRIKSIFRLERNLTTNEKAFADSWKKMGYGYDVIHHAYEITVENINKSVLKYANTILQNWKNKGLSTLAEIQEYEMSNKKNYNSDDPDDPALEKYKI